ncbi:MULTISPECIES: polysaccharide biosynthesis protein [unclassified Luteococcus]|uniref:polysaccharide biosynthesis protein n=1 Tax=unclassified Luteococcus TaxID=2639923 RepID=UPI00313BB40E
MLPINSATRARIVRGSIAAWDCLAWFVGIFAYLGARYDFEVGGLQWQLAFTYGCAAGVMQLCLGWATKLYRGRYRIGSFEGTFMLGTIVLGIGVLLGAYYSLFTDFSRGVVVTAPMGALIIMAWGHFVARAVLERNTPARTVEAPPEPVLIYGAGNAGLQLGRLIHNDPDSQYEIRGFLDDATEKRHLHLLGTSVRGTGEDMVRVALEQDVETIIIAMGSVTSEKLNKLNQAAEANGLKLLVLPTLDKMVGGQVSLAQLHEINVVDLLGRNQIKTDLGSIAGYLQGKVVLVTGAGGSIGSEIARQVYKFGPRELVMLDRDESGLHSTQLSIFNQGLLNTRNMALCDIRDADALERIFAEHRPDVVFHAAALKHLPMLEMYPHEGWKTNTLGSLNVLQMAEKYGAEKVINISTDKAADATSVLGKTKRIAEELTAYYGQKTGRSYLSVRFGNVLGSRGSMLETFTRQIAQGGPLTVTHPDITRYFMTIPEACELVIQAGAIGQPSEVLVLDMGEPVKILDVAKNLIARSGKNIEIVFTGLRPNEKMDEVLFSGDEAAIKTDHDLINRVSVPPLDPKALLTIDGSDPDSMATLTQQRAVELREGRPVLAVVTDAESEDTQPISLPQAMQG